MASFGLWLSHAAPTAAQDTIKVGILHSLSGTLAISETTLKDVMLMLVEAPNLTGGMSKMLPNHHITKPVMIGEIRADGQFDVVWQTRGLVPGDAWSDYLPGSMDLEAHRVDKKCGNFNKKTGKCGGA